jgi:hypothetical protein
VRVRVRVRVRVSGRVLVTPPELSTVGP